MKSILFVFLLVCSATYATTQPSEAQTKTFLSCQSLVTSQKLDLVYLITLGKQKFLQIQSRSLLNHQKLVLSNKGVGSNYFSASDKRLTAVVNRNNNLKETCKTGAINYTILLTSSSEEMSSQELFSCRDPLVAKRIVEICNLSMGRAKDGK